MSAFDSLFRSANAANLALLESELEAAATNLVINASGTLQSTTGTISGILSQSVTLAADDILHVRGKLTLSSSLATNAAALKLIVNSVEVDVCEAHDLPVIVTGQGDLLAVEAMIYDLSGSIPVRMDLLLTSGGGTIYTKRQTLIATVTKRK